MHPSVALYVGAGTDLPIGHVAPSHRIVCVDSQPYSEFGTEHCGCHAYTNCFSRARFIADLDRTAKRKGLALRNNDEGHVRCYGSRVRYYTNTSIPEHIDRLKPEGTFSTLLVRGHDPHEHVLDLLMPSDNTFVGFTDTVYSLPDSEESSVIRRLHTCASTRARFRVFTLIERETTRIHCNDWFDMIRHCHAVKKNDNPPLW